MATAFEQAYGWQLTREDGTWYREESKEMERTIREGRLMEKRGG